MLKRPRGSTRTERALRVMLLPVADVLWDPQPWGCMREGCCWDHQFTPALCCGQSICWNDVYTEEMCCSTTDRSLQPLCEGAVADAPVWAEVHLNDLHPHDIWVASKCGGQYILANGDTALQDLQFVVPTVSSFKVGSERGTGDRGLGGTGRSKFGGIVSVF